MLSDVVGRSLQLAGRAFLLLLALAIVAELLLRYSGIQPQSLSRAGFSATVNDRWTGWTMRPGVRLNEYTVTNAYGLHEDREVTLARLPNTPRVAVVGSSVTWAIGEFLATTIPRSVERHLSKAGCAAEVLNFAGIGYNILNASAYVQAKVHQFNPDVVVVVMDLQMAHPQFPSPVPVEEDKGPIKRLGLIEGLFKRATEYSALLTALDDVSILRGLLSKRLPFALDTKQPPAAKKAAQEDLGKRQLKQLGAWIEQRVVALADRLKAKDAAQPAVTIKPAPPEPPKDPGAVSVKAHESRRERELGSVVAALSAFSQGMGFQLYFVTPYGPYFQTGSKDFEKFSLGMLAPAVPIYGSLPAAAQRETEITSAIIERHATPHGARVIDMTPLSRAGNRSTGDFSTDGIHFVPQGYNRVASIIAERLVKDGFCTPDARVKPRG